MIKIIHGENHPASRKKLVELIGQAKTKNMAIESLNAKVLNLAKLETALAAKQLFNSQRLVIIENLHSLPRSKKKDSFLNLIINSETNLILWEKKQLTKTNLKKFPEAQIFEFKISQKLWTFLDHLSPKEIDKKKQLELLQKVLKKEDSIFVIAMLLRQIRMLIKAKENTLTKGAPFVISKVKKQSQKFSLKQLIKLHRNLAVFDKKIKNSENFLKIEKKLDLLIINM